MQTLYRAGILAMVTFLQLFAMPILARDSGQWSRDQAISGWFRSLRNRPGESCCDHSDGVRLEDPERREIDANVPQNPRVVAGIWPSSDVGGNKIRPALAALARNH